MFQPIGRATVLCRSDYDHIKKHLPRTTVNERWRTKLAHSTIVSDDLYSYHLIRIGSFVELKDLGTGSITTLVLTAKPSDPKLITSSRHPVSIYSPLGFTLIGMRLGDEINWTLPLGETRPLKISSVSYPLIYDPSKLLVNIADLAGQS